MSPAARKFKDNLNLPTINGVLKFSVIPNTFEELIVVHSDTYSKSLLEDWMSFTHVLGAGIIAEIS